MQTLAAFLGFIDQNGEATRAFDAAFGALELIKEGYLTEHVLENPEARSVQPSDGFNILARFLVIAPTR
jgi:hypothetical protein